MKKAIIAAILLSIALTGCKSAEKEIAALAGVTDAVVTAEQWAEYYPNQYASYSDNANNNVIFDHVEEYPMIATIYEGMAFNQYYNTARGHSYTLEDVAETGRPHALANCLSCKTPDYTYMVNEMGVEAYSLSFDDVYGKMNESVSCYNCHANEPGTINLTHEYLITAMEGETNVSANTLSCAQCHVEYYFDPETKATTLPYDGLESLRPDAILQYYKDMGFTDYTNPSTGVAQVKVQHPEFETYMGVGSVHANQFDCATCHMPTGEDENGETYTSHTWVSPLDSPELIANNCAACHTDLVAEVKEIQEDVESRTYEIGYELEDLTKELTAIVAEGTADEDALNEIRAAASDAQFYWDFVFVENAEGAHNSTLSHECLDKSEALLARAWFLIGNL